MQNYEKPEACKPRKISSIKSLNEELAENKKIEVRQIKYLNNIVEKDHRFIKRRSKPMLDSKAFSLLQLQSQELEILKLFREDKLPE